MRSLSTVKTPSAIESRMVRRWLVSLQERSRNDSTPPTILPVLSLRMAVDTLMGTVLPRAFLIFTGQSMISSPLSMLLPRAQSCSQMSAWKTS